jgi:hypothetical protein
MLNYLSLLTDSRFLFHCCHRFLSISRVQQVLYTSSSWSSSSIPKSGYSRGGDGTRIAMAMMTSMQVLSCLDRFVARAAFRRVIMVTCIHQSGHFPVYGSSTLLGIPKIKSIGPAREQRVCRVGLPCRSPTVGSMVTTQLCRWRSITHLTNTQKWDSMKILSIWIGSTHVWA